MKPITQDSVLAVIGDKTVTWNTLLFHFILDEERQYQRLEKTLEKLHQQNKIEVVKEVNPLDVMFGDHKGSMLRCYKFKKANHDALG